MDSQDRFRLNGFDDLSVIGSYVFVDRELSKMYGGHTQLANAEISGTSPEIYALTNVNVLTPSADNFMPGQTVLVEDGKIIAVGSDLDLSGNKTVINGKGKFLLPGFTDSHVHLWESKNDLLLYLANGVTQIREMNSLPETLDWKQEIANGHPGPDIFTVAPQFGTYGFFGGLFVSWTQHKTAVRTEKQIRKAVKSYAAKGYDAVKASSFLDREGYKALSVATLEYDIPLVGHIPMAVPLDDVWTSNQSEIAHIEELMKKLNDEFGGYGYDNIEEFLAYVRSRRNAVADKLKRENIAVASTLALVDSFHKQKSDLDSVLKASQLKYENPGISEGTIITSDGMGWLPDVNIYEWPGEWDEKRRRKSLAYWQAYSKAQHILLDVFIEKGVPIMTATDANVPVMVPGFSLHEEMKALKDAGMTPAQVLASTTLIPGDFMKIKTGKIVPGYKANLVLLHDNPLDNIQATESIDMVFSQGRIYSRDDLDAMLQAVADANDNSRNVHIEH